MPAMFNRQETHLNGVFSADLAKLNFAGKADRVKGTLIQGASFSYAQQVTRLYEVGAEARHTNVYYVSGRTQGTAGLSRVIGPKATIKELYEEFGDVCKAKENELSLILEEADCSEAGNFQKIAYTLRFCVLMQVGVSVQAQDMVINEQSQLMFSGLNYD